MIKILFIGKAKSDKALSTILRKQAESLSSIEGYRVIEYAIKGNGLTAYLSAVPQIREIALKHKVEIIHSHYALSTLSAYLAFTGIPLVASFMGDDLLESKNNKGKSTFTGKVIFRLSIWLSKRVDRLIVKSEEMKDRLPNKIHAEVIANGVDLDSFTVTTKESARKRLGLDLQAPCVIFVSDPNRPEKNFQLAREGCLLAEIKDSELHILQGLTHDELSIWYNAADALLLTSFHEGSPNVVKEAMACNCPIISAPVGDVSLLLQSSPNHYIVNYDPVDVANAIKQALSSRTRTLGRKRIIELGLDSHSVAKRLIDIYKQTIKKVHNVRH